MSLTDKQRGELDRCIRRGIKFLNKEKPGWTHVVDLRALNMKSMYSCVAGQALGTACWDHDVVLHNQIRYGFCPQWSISEHMESWAYLKQRWKEVIKEIRLADRRKNDH